ncbi:hypothetical protein RF644_07625 [Kocuria sp. CPCC 205258]|uniref:hypothetical protein n=1 Tax=Kocuria sp. CPCC 205258 TaxID=3073552 RepID=UPI0034D40093
MDTLDAEQLNSLVFGLAVMILTVVTVLGLAALVVKARTAHAGTLDRAEHAALLRRYEELSRSTATALDRQREEFTDVRAHLGRIEKHLNH